MRKNETQDSENLVQSICFKNSYKSTLAIYCIFSWNFYRQQTIKKQSSKLPNSSETFWYLEFTNIWFWNFQIYSVVSCTNLGVLKKNLMLEIIRFVKLMKNICLRFLCLLQRKPCWVWRTAPFAINLQFNIEK